MPDTAYAVSDDWSRHHTGSRVEPGYEFEPRDVTVTRDFQQNRHFYCDIRESFYGDLADPGIFATYPIRHIGHALFTNHPERGYVHTVQHIHQIQPIRVGEPVIATGSFTDLVDHPRGWIMHARFEYRRPNGDLLLVVSPEALMADPTRMPPPSEPTDGKPSVAGAAEPEAGWEVLLTKQCTPENVCGYCADTDNLIHTTPSEAQKFGFRAPITAGNQMIHWLLEAAGADGLRETFKVSARLKRPVFWDDGVTLVGRRENGRVVEVRALKSDGKTANDLVVTL